MRDARPDASPDAAPARPCPVVLVVMGVAGAGKTTVGRALASALAWEFHDADDFHTAASVARMRRGTPLTDADRAPWLAALGAFVAARVAAGAPAVLACSALREHYRAALVPDGAEAAVAFVLLDIVPALARARLRSRRGHFMPPSLVASQFRALEPPATALRVDAALPVPEIVARVRGAFGC